MAKQRQIIMMAGLLGLLFLVFFVLVFWGVETQVQQIHLGD